MTKVAFIGAGSVTFTRELLTDPVQLRGAARAGDRPSRHRRGTAGDRRAVARRLDDDLSGGARITAHAERRAALDGADFAINMVQVGMHEATVTDFDIPERHGLRQTIGDTLGVGGIFRALRTIPLMPGSARTWPRSRRRPGCSTTPTRWRSSCRPTPRARRTSASSASATPSRTPRASWHRGVPFEEVTYRARASTTRRGCCASSAAARTSTRSWTRDRRRPRVRRRVRVDMYRRFGYFPTESSEHSSEYLPWYLRHPRRSSGCRPGRRVRGVSEENLDEYERSARRSRRAIRCRRAQLRVRTRDHPLDGHRHRRASIYGNVRNAA